MSETPQKKQDFLEQAKHQFAQLTAEFEKALDALKDPDRRRQLTSSYLDMLQKGLSRAQDSVAKYQDKIAAQTPPEPGPTGTPESGNARPPEQPN
jgi:chromosome segregation ATPase